MDSSLDVGPCLELKENKLRRLMLAAAISSLLLVGGATTASADPHNAGGPHRSEAPCTISPSPAAVGQVYVVTATGLPMRSAVNLWVTDPTGSTTGSPLGSTPDGTFA